MAAIEQVLNEEYDRLIRVQGAIKNELAELPNEYISTKKISGRNYYYLQKREGSKVSSKYIPSSDVEDWATRIKRRKQLEEQLKDIESILKKLKRAMR